MQSYFVLSASGDGDIYFEQYTYDKLQEWLVEMASEDSPMEFLDTMPDLMYLDAKQYYIIKGVNVVPKARERVIAYDVD